MRSIALGMMGLMFIVSLQAQQIRHHGDTLTCFFTGQDTVVAHIGGGYCTGPNASGLQAIGVMMPVVSTGDSCHIEQGHFISGLLIDVAFASVKGQSDSLWVEIHRPLGQDITVIPFKKAIADLQTGLNALIAYSPVFSSPDTIWIVVRWQAYDSLPDSFALNSVMFAPDHPWRVAYDTSQWANAYVVQQWGSSQPLYPAIFPVVSFINDVAHTRHEQMCFWWDGHTLHLSRIPDHSGTIFVYHLSGQILYRGPVRTFIPLEARPWAVGLAGDTGWRWYRVGTGPAARCR